MRHELPTTALEKYQTAIRQGDKDVALPAAQMIWDGWRPLHGRYVEMPAQ